MNALRLIRLSELALADGQLPTAFRIFRAGVNDSTKGSVVFDDEAAASVMSRYEREGVDLMVDREHDSVDPATRVARADAADALGWFRLEVRDGELWAVDVRWTPEGEERLRARKQRYISPYFGCDEDDRVRAVVNVALVSMPATHDAAPLVAANKGADALQTETWSMDPKKVKAALDALEAGDGDAAKEILKGMIADAAGAGEEEAPAEAPAEEPAADEATAEGADAPPAEEEEIEEQSTTLSTCKYVLDITGAEELTSALNILTEWKEERERERVAAAKRADAERVEAVAKLVKLGVELPADAWECDGVPTERLRDEPLEDLKGRVERLSKAHKAAPRALKPPAGDGLTEHELALVKRNKMSPEQRERFAARRAARRNI